MAVTVTATSTVVRLLLEAAAAAAGVKLRIDRPGVRVAGVLAAAAVATTVAAGRKQKAVGRDGARGGARDVVVVKPEAQARTSGFDPD